jgi:hypothetical protein
MSKSIVKILIERSVPSFIQDEYPLFVSFLEAYYEWLEEEKNIHDIAINFTDYRNIDDTLDDFLEYFRKELFPSIPSEIAADKRLLAKHIKRFYLNKGNESSYRLFFKLLYGEELEFYYPKVDILRASDGKWYEKKALKITYDETVLQYISGKRITGVSSGASAIVESAFKIIDRNTDIIELTLSDIRGTFSTQENISFSYIDVNGETQTSTGEVLYDVLSTITVTTGGSGFAVNDVFSIVDGDSAEIGTAVVQATTRGGITGFTIDDAGTGYNGEERLVTAFYGLPSNHTLNGDYLPDTEVDGSGSGSSGTDYTAYTFDEVISLQTIESEGDLIQVTDRSGLGSGAVGIVTEVNTDGEIVSTSIVTEGEGYDAPVATVISDTGTGAELVAIGGGGAITTAQLQNFPIVFDSDYDSNGLTFSADFTGIGDENAIASFETGTLENYPGEWLNDDGHLSSTKVLQDNYYYQDYSYVLKSSQSSDKWRDFISDVLHPAGLELFGAVNIIQLLRNNIDNETQDVNIIIDGNILPEDSNDETDSFTPDISNVVNGTDNVVHNGNNVITLV